MLKIEKEVFKAEIFGKEYVLTYPSLGDQEIFISDLADVDKSELEVIYSFYEKAGIPMNVCKQLQKPHLKAIGEALHGEKKD
jgi:hypothetical protein